MDLSLGKEPFIVVPALQLSNISHRFYVGSKFNVVVCDRLLVEEILIHNNENLTSGGPYTVRQCLIHQLTTA